MLRLPPSTKLVPYTTLFRSMAAGNNHDVARSIGLQFFKRVFVGDVNFVSHRKPRGVGEGLAIVNHSDSESGGVSGLGERDRKSTRLNSSHLGISYAVFCLKK